MACVCIWHLQVNMVTQNVNGEFVSFFKRLLPSTTRLFSVRSENRAKGGGICVANHTTPVDVIFLSSDNCYAYVSIYRWRERPTNAVWPLHVYVLNRSISCKN